MFALWMIKIKSAILYIFQSKLLDVTEIYFLSGYVYQICHIFTRACKPAKIVCIVFFYISIVITAAGIVSVASVGVVMFTFQHLFSGWILFLWF